MAREFVREKVRRRDLYTCQNCKKVRTPEFVTKWGVRSFDVHHLNGLCGKKSRGYDKVSEMDGLITLCHKCHFNRHDFNGKHSPYIHKKFVSRIQEILKLRQEGYTLQSIAIKYGITRQRIGQIVAKELSTDL